MRRRTAQYTVVLAAWATFGCGCGHSSVPVPPQVTVGLTPAVASIVISQQVQFQALVSGTQDARVTWSVQEGAGGGSVDANGLYTAAAAGAWHVVARSVADPSASGVAAITVHAPPPPPLRNAAAEPR